MGIIKGNNIVGGTSQGQKLLQKRQGDKVVGNLPSITFTATVNSGTAANRPNAGSIVWTFDKTLDYIVGNYNIGDNVNLFKKVTSAKSISKSFATNTDNNGSGNGISFESWNNNYIYLPTTIGITKVTVGITGNYVGSSNYSFNELFPDLVTFEIGNTTLLNFDFLAGMPLVKNINMTQINNSVPTNLPALKDHQSLLGLWIKGTNSRSEVAQIITNLPAQLYYARLEHCTGLVIDIKDYFTGTRIGLSFGVVALQQPLTVKYTGGAIFPSVISEGDIKIDFILGFRNSNVANPMSADDQARFIVDFANQVTSVTTTAKIIRIVGGAPNTSYVDNSKPLYKTYTDALNFIRNTLGVTVQFT